MTADDAGEHWIDEEAGRLIRPYTVSNGRTAPTTTLDLLSMVMTTGKTIDTQFAPEHAQVLSGCRVPASVAEISARIRLPVVVTKIILSDLIDHGALTFHASGHTAEPTDRNVLEALLHGLQQRL